MNSTIKAAAKFEGELNQSNENSDTKNEGIQHIKAKLGASLKKNWKVWPVYYNYGQRAYQPRRHVPMAVEGRAERRD